MSVHLSDKQITTCIAGAGSFEETEHLRTCPECAAAVARFENAVLGLREILSRRAEERSSRPLPAYAERPVAPRGQAVVWGGAIAAAALAIAVVPAYWPVVETPPEQSVKADVELLEQVDQQLSRSVPRTLEPLMDLLAAEEMNPDETEGNPQ